MAIDLVGAIRMINQRTLHKVNFIFYNFIFPYIRAYEDAFIQLPTTVEEKERLFKQNSLSEKLRSNKHGRYDRLIEPYYCHAV